MLAFVCRPAEAQPPVPGALVTTWNNATVPGTAATNNWTSASNWSGGVPNVDNEDYGVINNGGVAYVNSTPSTTAGGVSLGTNAGESGTLQILSGGNLTVADDVPGGGGFPADGAVRVGQVGTGTLVIQPGGTLKSDLLLLGGTDTSSITLGGTAAGATTINTGTVELNRTTRVIGPNVNFSATGPITLGGLASSRLIAEITGPNHSALKTTGTATLNGALELDFNGYVPTAVDSWNLVDAATISGTFSSIVPDPDVTLSPGTMFNVRTVAGGNGQQAQLFLQQLLVLNVNRNSGEVTIKNPGTTSVGFDGYGIRSAAGSLNSSDAVWNSLEEQPGVAGPNWHEGQATSNQLVELRPSGTSNVVGGAAWSLGNVFDPPAPTAFGQEVEDLVFAYNDPVSNSTVTSSVEYTGSGSINNLVLSVDPVTGQATMHNTSPFTVAIDGYTISSAGGSLNSNPAAWSSLQDQVGNTWAEANLKDTRVSELQSNGSTTLLANNGTTFNLGGLFNTADPKDLVFQFVLANGNVPGDYNDDGTVNAADYTVWRNHLGETFQLQNEVDNTTPGMVTPEDYDAWKANFGSTSGVGEATTRTGVVVYESIVGGSGSLALGGGAVPEPASWLLACLCGVLTLSIRPGKR
jgi:hypothetical protein